MASDDLDRFCNLVLEDAALQKQLRTTCDWSAFARRVARLAADHGCTVTAAEVEQALRARRREWLERWI
jgi:hypothetical protein